MGKKTPKERLVKYDWTREKIYNFPEKNIASGQKIKKWGKWKQDKFWDVVIHFESF